MEKPPAVSVLRLGSEGVPKSAKYLLIGSTEAYGKSMTHPGFVQSPAKKD